MSSPCRWVNRPVAGGALRAYVLMLPACDLHVACTLLLRRART